MHRPKYAEITSTLALFIALGGVSWAATTLPKNSVSSAAIRAGAVTPAKLSKDLRSQLGVTTASPSGKSGTDGQSGSDGKSGTDGKAGPAGAPGAQGPAGRDGAALVAQANLGAIGISKAQFVKVGSMDWNQPANTLEDVRGTYLVRQAGCGNGGTVPYQLVVDGQEISYDTGNSGVNNSSDSWNPEAEISPPWGGKNQMPTDRGSIGSEIPLVTGGAAASHHLDMYMRSDFCGSVTFDNVTLYVTQYAAG